MRVRPGLINTARGLTKSYGERLRGCNVRNMDPQKAEDLSPELQAALQPLRALLNVSSRHCRVQRADREAGTMSYPQVTVLKQLKGVGTPIALTFR